ncbi:hypothetical protein EES43_18275 [Streptomyces sp. ADI96-02]|uniref:DUF4276 family protein n=1 Tax=Streptomyces sp. ADI96-02 TaxID=1522760 RepID=UPI000F55112A|nr:DUF4276 family protein [Streptomyces sp. ADI96-02]RPK59663.1 hypothetical protein EES43_18275 [Streptomyces sp. ADI96-02]
MTYRVLFIGEGSSDNGLVPHVESIAVRKGLEISVTVPDFGLLRPSTGHSVPGKLRAIRALGGTYDLAVVRRDADRGLAQDRRDEIEEAVDAEWPGLQHVAVVPVRMLEAWLLLDEECLRQVAENPRGRVGLDLPKGVAAEKVADPKQLLKDSPAQASEYKGRRLAQFQKRFSQHRLRMLELLDPEGPVACLPSWQGFVKDLDIAFDTLGG